jgi:hypothetical protein
MPLHRRAKSRIGARVSPSTHDMLQNCMAWARALGIQQGTAEYVLWRALFNRGRRLRAECRKKGIDPWALPAVQASVSWSVAEPRPHPRGRWGETGGRSDPYWIRRPYPSLKR